MGRVQFHMDRDGFEAVAFGLEPTSVYHKPLAEFLIEQGCLVVYATNEAIKKNRSLLDGRWDKNDTKCSANVGEVVYGLEPTGNYHKPAGCTSDPLRISCGAGHWQGGEKQPRASRRSLGQK
jgi:hypothetical protein